IVAIMPGNGRIACRAAFGMSGHFEDIHFTESKNTIIIEINFDLGHYKVEVDFPNESLPILHYKTTFTSKMPHMIPFWPRDIIPLTHHGRVENTYGTIHIKQVGSRSGLLFAS